MKVRRLNEKKDNKVVDVIFQKYSVSDINDMIEREKEFSDGMANEIILDKLIDDVLDELFPGVETSIDDYDFYRSAIESKITKN